MKKYIIAVFLNSLNLIVDNNDSSINRIWMNAYRTIDAVCINVKTSKESKLYLNDAYEYDLDFDRWNTFQIPYWKCKSNSYKFSIVSSDEQFFYVNPIFQIDKEGLIKNKLVYNGDFQIEETINLKINKSFCIDLNESIFNYTYVIDSIEYNPFSNTFVVFGISENKVKGGSFNSEYGGIKVECFNNNGNYYLDNKFSFLTTGLIPSKLLVNGFINIDLDFNLNVNNLFGKNGRYALYES